MADIGMHYTLRTALGHEIIMSGIWSNRGSENVIGMNFSPGPRRKRSAKLLDITEYSIGYGCGCGVDIIGEQTLLSWRSAAMD